MKYDAGIKIYNSRQTPGRELDYLKQNIRPEPDLKLVVTGKK